MEREKLLHILLQNVTKVRKNVEELFQSQNCCSILISCYHERISLFGLYPRKRQNNATNKSAPKARRVVLDRFG